ncbi:MAG TPA: amidophosphoribosyltransferase [archaeon]|nr:amidophosphoribosyltransferase [archaeon]
MDKEVHEECGLAGIAIFNDLRNHPWGGSGYYLLKMLHQQQNRGQLSAGISSFNPDRTQILDTFKDNGSVNEVFKLRHEYKFQHVLKKISGSRGIGHVRYATSGRNTKDYAHPFERHHGRKWKWFSFAVNGNLANYFDLKESLGREQYHLVRETDTEVIMHHISKGFDGPDRKDPIEVFKEITPEFDGSFNIFWINAEGDQIFLRDPIGFKPLCFGEKDKMFAAASESVALNTIGIFDFDYVKPGELISIKGKKVEKLRYAKSRQIKRCMFEWVYFANVSSVLDGRSVYDVRWELGKELAKKETVKADDNSIVVPVPATSKPMADAFAHELGIPSKEGLVVSRYNERTFIEAQERGSKVRDKFNLIKSVVQGKKIFLVDDSIVRGTTMKNLVEFIRSVGQPKEIHLRIACPPIRNPCFYGIDFSTLGELQASKAAPDSVGRTGFKDMAEEEIDKIRKDLGVDSLIYQSLDGLMKALKFPREELCTACLTGEYPTEHGKILYGKAIENFLNKTEHGERTH